MVTGDEVGFTTDQDDLSRLAALLLLAASCSSADEPPVDSVEVLVYGEMREVLREGRGHGRVEVASVKVRTPSASEPSRASRGHDPRAGRLRVSRVEQG